MKTQTDKHGNIIWFKLDFPGNQERKQKLYRHLINNGYWFSSSAVNEWFVKDNRFPLGISFITKEVCVCTSITSAAAAASGSKLSDADSLFTFLGIANEQAELKEKTPE